MLRPFASKSYHPVVALPSDVIVLDLSGVDAIPHKHPWTIGKYNEIRGIYNQPMFGGDRVVHLGIDIGAPVGTEVHAFDEGAIYAIGVNPAKGDYGPTLITEHQVDGQRLWVLHGHLSWKSIMHHKVGEPISHGQVIAEIGSEAENGGWPPHLHFQLSTQAPEGHDMRGVFTLEEAIEARAVHPDPRIILGDIY